MVSKFFSLLAIAAALLSGASAAPAATVESPFKITIVEGPISGNPSRLIAHRDHHHTLSKRASGCYGDIWIGLGEIHSGASLFCSVIGNVTIPFQQVKGLKVESMGGNNGSVEDPGRVAGVYYGFTNAFNRAGWAIDYNFCKNQLDSIIRDCQTDKSNIPRSSGGYLYHPSGEIVVDPYWIE